MSLSNKQTVVDRRRVGGGLKTGRNVQTFFMDHPYRHYSFFKQSIQCMKKTLVCLKRL